LLALQPVTRYNNDRVVARAYFLIAIGVQSLWLLIVPVRLFGQLTHTRLAMLMAYAAANLQGAE
jgi:hypothetical protein